MKSPKSPPFEGGESAPIKASRTGRRRGGKNILTTPSAPLKERGHFFDGAATAPPRGGDFGLIVTWCLVMLGVIACQPLPQYAPPPTTPQRIISVVPSATEMLFAFGLDEKVIAVGDYDRFPPEVSSKPRIGGLLNPNIEKIIEMKPDLVVAYGSQDTLGERLKALGIRYHLFVHGNAEDTLRAISDLGRIVGAEESSDKIVGDIRKTFDELRAQAPPKKPKVLLVHNRGAGMLGSFYTVGSKTFQHDLINIAGGENTFGDVDREALQPSIEEVIKRAPDIIIETLPPPIDERDVIQRKKDWESLGLAKGRVHILGENYYLVPGPRLHLAARGFAEIIRRFSE